MLDEIVAALRRATSLDPQPDQGLGQTAGELAASFVPGVGQAMALRDMERARREGDIPGMGLAAVGLIPGGALAKGLRTAGAPIQKIIAGEKALKAPATELAAAKGALDAGRHPESVWQEFGGYQGLENHAPMKWEIPDTQAAINTKALREGKYTGKMEDVLDHPKLYENYPALRQTEVSVELGPKAVPGGSFLRGVEDLQVPANIEASGNSYKDLLSTLLHEAQHNVQHIEGFSPGASDGAILDALRTKHPAADERRLANVAMQQYMRNMGETEARMVESRLKNSPSFNRSIHPFESMDVPAHLQLE